MFHNKLKHESPSKWCSAISQGNFTNSIKPKSPQKNWLKYGRSEVPGNLLDDMPLEPEKELNGESDGQHPLREEREVKAKLIIVLFFS